MQHPTPRRRTLPPAPAGTAIGKRLRELRGSLSIAGLAQKSGVRSSRLYQAEYRDTFGGFTVDELEAVAGALGVAVNELTGEGAGHAA